LTTRIKTAKAPTSDFVSETPIRVRYAETDAMGIAHHSAYVVWFEAGRSDYMRQRGSSYAEFEAKGYGLPVTELDARFVRPAFYDEMVVVRTKLHSLRSRKLTFEYEVVREGTGELLASGHTSHICVDERGVAITIPEFARKLLMGD